MKFNRITIEKLLENAPKAKPSLTYKIKVHYNIMHAMNKNTISYLSGFRILVPHTASLLVVFVVLMTSSVTTLYAYGNPNITTGNPLYLLKTGVESVEQILAFSPESKADVFTKMATRRTEEAMIIAEKTGSINADVIQEVKINNSKALTHAKTISTEQHKEKTKVNMVNSSVTQKQNLEKVKNIAVNKVKEEQKDAQNIVSLNDKGAIFLSAPVTMDNLSVRDRMRIEEGENTDFGLVEETDETLVITGFLPEDEDLFTEEEIIADSPDIKLVESTLEDVESRSNSDKMDSLLDEESMFIN